MGGGPALERNCSEFLERLGEIARQAGRRPEDITVVGAAKTRSLEDVREAIAAGIVQIGENRVQEAEQKYRGAIRDFRLHLIGHLQSNKARKAVELFDVIQSVDSLALAGTLDREFERAGRVGEVMLEVNTSGEPQKYGFTPAEVPAVAKRVFAMRHLRLTGLMTVGPLTEDEQEIRRAFRGLRGLREDIRAEHAEQEQFTTLSMGMSDDFEIAVAEGATMIRVGRALFGPREI